MIGLATEFATAKTFRAGPIIPGRCFRCTCGRRENDCTGYVCVELERLFRYNIYTNQGWELSLEDAEPGRSSSPGNPILGGYLLAKGTVKKATGFFFCWMGLMASVCVPSFIVGVAHTEPGGPVTVLTAPVAGLNSNFISMSNTAMHERAAHAGRQQITEGLDHLCAVNQNGPSASF